MYCTRVRRSWKPSWLAGSIITALLSFTPLFALDPQRTLTQYGLAWWSGGSNQASVAISGIAQTSDGYLWLATNSGLLRFDGVKFTSFTTSNSKLRSNSITALWADDSGTLWIGQEAGGLCRITTGVMQCLGEMKGMPKDQIGSIVGDGADGVWFSVPEVGLGHYRNGRLDMLTPSNGLPNPNVNRLWLAKDGTLWAGTFDSGVVTYRNGHFRVIQAPILSNNLVWDLAQDKDGDIWLATFSGLCRMRSASDEKPIIYRHGAGLPSDDVTVVFADREGRIWAASDAGGLSRFEGTSFSGLDTRDGLSDDSVRSVMEDREGNIWIGTKGGLNQLHDQNFSIINARGGLAESSHRVVLERSDGSLWAGGFKKGLDIVEPDANSGLQLSHLAVACSALAEYESSAKVFWLGCAGGTILKLDNKRIVGRYPLQAKNRFVEVNAISELTPGRLVAATFGLGLAELRGNRWVGRSFHPKAEHISALLGNADGLWASSLDAGVFLVKRDGSVVDFSNQMPGLVPSRLSRDHDNSVWVITKSGLAHIENGVVQVSSLANTPLQDCTPYSLIDDGRDAYWVTSSRGVFRLPRDYLRSVMAGRRPSSSDVVIYGLAEGVTAVDNVGFAQPTATLASDGKLWIATHKGLLSVDPSRLKSNRLAPPVRIERIFADDKPIEPSGRSWRIPAGRHRVEIQYAALSLTVPAKVRFRYQLNGFDTTPIEANESRSAVYTDIPPGDYSFHVTAANNDGVWNPEGAEITLSKEPHYYQTFWFQGLCALSAVALLCIFYRRQMQRVKRETQRIQTAVEDTRRQAAEQRAGELAKLNASLRENLIRLSDASQIGGAMEHLLESATEQLHARGSCVFIHEKTSKLLRRVYVHDGAAPHHSDERRAYYARCEHDIASDGIPLWAHFASSRCPYILDLRESADAALLWHSAVKRHLEMEQPVSIGVPLLVGGETIGFMGVNFGADRNKGSFTSDDLQLVESIASLASMALETHRLSALARDAAVAEERTKLSEEMHDGIQQIFSAVSFQLAGASTLARRSGATQKLSDQIDRAAEIAEHGIAEVRRSIQTLRDIHPMSGPEFLGSLEALCRSCDSEETRCIFEHDAGVTLVKSRKLNDLFRIAQEAVGNAYKHSGASQVVVKVISARSGVELFVIDNGSGFDEGHSKMNGLGLSSMHQRAKRIDAKLQVNSGEEGTQVTVSDIVL